jgi:hypothetical protein
MGVVSKEAQIRSAISLIWRNLGNGISTFSKCPNGCKIGGRGAGPCIECAESQLAKLTSRDKAKRYVMAVKEVRRIEGEMMASAMD